MTITRDFVSHPHAMAITRRCCVISIRLTYNALAFTKLQRGKHEIELQRIEYMFGGTVWNNSAKSYHR